MRSATASRFRAAAGAGLPVADGRTDGLATRNPRRRRFVTGGDDTVAQQPGAISSIAGCHLDGTRQRGATWDTFLKVRADQIRFSMDRSPTPRR